MAEPNRNVLLYLAAEGVVPVLGGCAGALAGGAEAGLAGVAVGHAVEKAINLFGKGIVERWRAWFAAHPKDAPAAVAELAAVPVAEARAEARSILLDLAPAADEHDVAAALEFLTAIPRAAGRALVPNADGTRSLPPTVTFDDPRSLLQLLPEDLPPYPASADLPGTPYRLVEILGTGGFGAVYRAVSPTLQHLPLAIKFCLDRSLLPSLNLERSNLERLMRAGGRGSDHVVRLYGYDLDHATPYLVYEFVAGGNLTDLLAARRAALGRPPGCAEVLGWIAQLAEGLAFAHRAGLVHRDVKPANVLASAECGVRSAERDPAGAAALHSALRTPRSALKLADFGLGGAAAARAAVRSRIGASTLDYLSLADQASLFRGAGTPLYMCPEQRRGASPDPRHDLYSLGVVWFQLLAGDVSRELHAGWAKELTAKFGVPADHVALIARCVGWYEERPKDAGELLPLLKELGATESTLAVEPEKPADSIPWAAPIADTARNASQITSAPTSGSGLRRELLASMVAKLDDAHAVVKAAQATVEELKRTPHRSAVMWGFLVGLLVGWLVGETAYWTRNNTGSFPNAFGPVPIDWVANTIGIVAGLAVWFFCALLPVLGATSREQHARLRGGASLAALKKEFPTEVAAWGGEPVLREPALVRKIREELDPPKPPSPQMAMTAAPPETVRGDWAALLPDIVAEPVRKRAFVGHLRQLEGTVRSAATTIEEYKVLSIFFAILGYCGAIGLSAWFINKDGSPVIGVLIGLVVAGMLTAVAVSSFRLGREGQRGRARRSAADFAATYPMFADRCGGIDGLRNPQFVASVLAAVDDPKTPGFFGRVFGGR